MSRREKERKASLDALGKLAYSVGGGAPPPPPPPAAKRSSLPPPKPAPSPAPAPRAADAAASRNRQSQLAARQEKLAEERALKQRRENELLRSRNLEWRGMSNDGIPASIRRTGFDRVEPNVSTKITDVLGAPREKEGRAKARDKGRRQGGGR